MFIEDLNVKKDLAYILKMQVVLQRVKDIKRDIKAKANERQEEI